MTIAIRPKDIANLNKLILFVCLFVHFSILLSVTTHYILFLNKKNSFLETCTATAKWLKNFPQYSSHRG